MKFKNWQELKNKVHGVGVEHVRLRKKKKSPGTNSGTYWPKIYTDVSTTCKQTITLGVHSGGMGVTGAVVGGRELTREWRGFPPSKWGEVEVWVDGLCHWLDDPKTESNSSASQETKSFLKFLLYCIIFSYLWILMKSPLPLWALLSHVKWLHKK